MEIVAPVTSAVVAEQRLAFSVPIIRDMGCPDMRELMGKQRQTSIKTSVLVLIERCIEYMIGMHPDGQDPAAFETAFTTWRRASHFTNSSYIVAIICTPRCCGFLMIHAKLAVEYEEIESVTQDLDGTAGDSPKIRETTVMKDLVLSPGRPAAGLG